MIYIFIIWWRYKWVIICNEWVFFIKSCGYFYCWRFRDCFDWGLWCFMMVIFLLMCGFFFILFRFSRGEFIRCIRFLVVILGEYFFLVGEIFCLELFLFLVVDIFCFLVFFFDLNIGELLIFGFLVFWFWFWIWDKNILLLVWESFIEDVFVCDSLFVCEWKFRLLDWDVWRFVVLKFLLVLLVKDFIDIIFLLDILLWR